MLFVLYLQVDSSEERARGSRSIDVTCIAVHALVDVALEMVEQVLYASVDLQGIVLVERNIIAEFDVPLEEDWCLNLFIFWYIARKVLHEHTASDLAVSDNVEMLYRFDIAEEVAIVVRGAEHATLRCNVWIIAPLLRFDITAMVIGISCLESKQMTISHFGFYIQSCHPCATSIRTSQQQVSFFIMTILHQCEYIIQLRKEAF